MGSDEKHEAKFWKAGGDGDTAYSISMVWFDDAHEASFKENWFPKFGRRGGSRDRINSIFHGPATISRTLPRNLLYRWADGMRNGIICAKLRNTSCWELQYYCTLTIFVKHIRDIVQLVRHLETQKLKSNSTESRHVDACRFCENGSCSPTRSDPEILHHQQLPWHTVQYQHCSGKPFPCFLQSIWPGQYGI